MVDALETNNVIGQVEFHKRLDESNIIMKDRFQSGELGSALYFIVEYSQRKIIPSKVFQSWVTESNVFNYLGVHYIDLIYFISGYKPKSVIGWGQKSI